MKGKLLLGLIALAAAGFIGYQYTQSQNASVDEENVRASFKNMSAAISAGDKKTIETLVSSKFADETLKKRDEFIKVLLVPRKSYSADISSVRMQGADLALVYYGRTEIRGERGKLLKDDVKGEIWGRDSANPNLWKLNKLAPGDKWFRTAEIPSDAAEGGGAEAGTEPVKEEPVLGSLEKKAEDAKAKEAEAKAKEAEAKAKEAEAGKGEAKAEAGKGEVPKVVDIKATLASVTAPGEKRYNPMGKKDPFLPWGSTIETVGPKGCDPLRPKEFLEGYELLSLKVQGIILTEGEPMALVTTPDGKGYTVRRSMYLGKNCGKVNDIDEDRIKITEKKKNPADPFSEWEPVDSELKLRPEEGT
jgi:Tfp pilus assembly protein PilP